MSMGFYQTAKWKRKREKILRRDGYMCQESKRYGRIVQADTVHHVFPLEEYPELAYADWNLISLSASVHDKMHDRVSGALTDMGKDLQVRIARKYNKTLL